MASKRNAPDFFKSQGAPNSPPPELLMGKVS
jgi:hypothetical protein